MNTGPAKYKADDIAVIIPTKDRPAKVRNLLASIRNQSVRCGRIIIIDGAENAKPVARDFNSDLHIDYRRCFPPGQIRQRNLAISMLTSETPLVCLFDDDIVLVDQAMEAMLSFWNRQRHEPAGVSFNVINTEPDRFTRLLHRLSRGRIPGGRVFRSGMTTSNCQVQKDLKTQWLCGGATVWRQTILKTFSHREIPSLWAINEDLIFSYPVGKKFRLYVCAGAQVRHEHEYDYAATNQFHFKGLYETMWRIYFIRKHKELSLSLFLAFLLLMVGSNLFLALLTRERHHLAYARGQVTGALKMLQAGRETNAMVAALTNAS